MVCCRVLAGCTTKAEERARYLASWSRTAHPAAVCAATGCLLLLHLPSTELVLTEKSTIALRAEKSRAVLLVEGQASRRVRAHWFRPGLAPTQHHMQLKPGSAKRLKRPHCAAKTHT